MDTGPALHCGIQLVRTQPNLLVTLWVESDFLPSCLLRLTLEAEGWRVVTVGTVPRPVPDVENEAQASEETEDEDATAQGDDASAVLGPDAQDQPLPSTDPLS